MQFRALTPKPPAFRFSVTQMHTPSPTRTPFLNSPVRVLFFRGLRWAEPWQRQHLSLRHGVRVRTPGRAVPGHRGEPAEGGGFPVLIAAAVSTGLEGPSLPSLSSPNAPITRGCICALAHRAWVRAEALPQRRLRPGCHRLTSEQLERRARRGARALEPGSLRDHRRTSPSPTLDCGPGTEAGGTEC